MEVRALVDALRFVFERAERLARPNVKLYAEVIGPAYEAMKAVHEDNRRTFDDLAAMARGGAGRAALGAEIERRRDALETLREDVASMHAVFGDLPTGGRDLDMTRHFLRASVDYLHAYWPGEDEKAPPELTGLAVDAGALERRGDFETLAAELKRRLKNRWIAVSRRHAAAKVHFAT